MIFNKTVAMLSCWMGTLGAAMRGERGFGVVEALVAVAIFGVGVTAGVAALSTGSMAVNTLDQEATLQSLASSQLAYIKSYPYDTDTPLAYPTVDTLDATYNPNPVTMPAGYSIDVKVSRFIGSNSDIQKIKVTVSRDNGESLLVEDIKVNR